MLIIEYSESLYHKIYFSIEKRVCNELKECLKKILFQKILLEFSFTYQIQNIHGKLSIKELKINDTTYPIQNLSSVIISKSYLNNILKHDFKNLNISSF